MKRFSASPLLRSFASFKAPTATLSAVRQATLGDLLRQVAFAQVPSRFSTVLQLCAPFAVQAWVAGWYRAAGWLAAASCFGIWALAQQKLTGHADTLGPPVEPPSFMWRVIRGGAALVGGLTAGLMAADAVTRLLAFVFRCPGCAG